MDESRLQDAGREAFACSPGPAKEPMKEVPLADPSLPDDPVSVLSRQYALVVDQLAATGAKLRETESALARVYVLNGKLKAALRDLHSAGGGE